MSLVLNVYVVVAHRSCRFFFFKQKTAYEMRISDWSSDVCSSDLIRGTMMRLVGEALSPGFASELLVESLSTALAVELRRHFDILDPEDVSREGGLSSSQVRRIRERQIGRAHV